MLALCFYIEERDVELVCTLRENVRDPARTRVKAWVNEYAQTRGLKKFQANEVRGLSYISYAWRGGVGLISVDVCIR